MEDREIIENEESTECEIVKEVRETRHKISARFDHDVGRLVVHYQELQEQMRQSGKYKFADLPTGELELIPFLIEGDLRRNTQAKTPYDVYSIRRLNHYNV